MWEGESILDVELNGSTAGYIALAAKARESTVIASKWPNIIAGAGSVKSSAGTKIAWIEVIEPSLVATILSWIEPISVQRVG